MLPGSRVKVLNELVEFAVVEGITELVVRHHVVVVDLVDPLSDVSVVELVLVEVVHVVWLLVGVEPAAHVYQTLPFVLAEELHFVSLEEVLLVSAGSYFHAVVDVFVINEVGECLVCVQKLVKPSRSPRVELACNQLLLVLGGSVAIKKVREIVLHALDGALLVIVLLPLFVIPPQPEVDFIGVVLPNLVKNVIYYIQLVREEFWVCQFDRDDCVVSAVVVCWIPVMGHHLLLWGLILVQF